MVKIYDRYQEKKRAKEEGEVEVRLVWQKEKLECVKGACLPRVLSDIQDLLRVSKVQDVTIEVYKDRRIYFVGVVGEGLAQRIRNVYAS